jgi:hypothetical protein
MPQHYLFKGKKEEIVNSILSLLLGKEYYEEVSLYSNFTNDSLSKRYRKRLEAILVLMQEEHLILIRDEQEDSHDKSKSSTYSNTARVYLRQHGKEVLSAGGYKKSKKENDLVFTLKTLPDPALS